jgi:hypothetical protein
MTIQWIVIINKKKYIEDAGRVDTAVFRAFGRFLSDSYLWNVAYEQTKRSVIMNTMMEAKRRTFNYNKPYKFTIKARARKDSDPEELFNEV